MDVNSVSLFVGLSTDSSETKFSSFQSLITVYIGALKLQGWTMDWKSTDWTLAGGFRWPEPWLIENHGQNQESWRNILKYCFLVLLESRSRDSTPLYVGVRPTFGYRRGQWTLMPLCACTVAIRSAIYGDFYKYLIHDKAPAEISILFDRWAKYM